MRPHELVPTDAASCVFAGRTARFSFVASREPVEWTLSAGSRAIRQGTVEAAAPSVISISVPNLEPGVTLSAELRLSWKAAGRVQEYNRPVTIFSPDPFGIWRAALEQAEIALFDPQGDTATVFDRHEIPYAPLRNLAAIDQVQSGVVIVGEGVSLREQPKLFPTLLRAAGRGVSVICLAPVDGEFAFPEPEVAPKPVRVALERGDVVRRYDKRFDLLPSIVRFAVEPRHNQVVIRTTESDGGWSWIQIDCAMPGPPSRDASPGRLIVCGMSIIRDWETTPVPRYLLIDLLTERTATSLAEENKNDEFTQR